MDRPASALKELIENSIDAHATQIDLFLAEGGVQEMRVVDNGDGIHPDDFPLLATSHATSKIRHIGDLEFASTLGFRGEALHALSVVSTLRIRSRRDGFSGMEASFSGGEATEILPVGITKGTVVIQKEVLEMEGEGLVQRGNVRAPTFWRAVLFVRPSVRPRPGEGAGMAVAPRSALRRLLALLVLLGGAAAGDEPTLTIEVAAESALRVSVVRRPALRALPQPLR